MKTTRLLALIALAAPLSVMATGNEPTVVEPEVDTSNWKCKFCEVEEGWRGDSTAGLGYVSDDSYKFGEYTGLKDEGLFLIGDANLVYRDEEARYIDFSITDIGLDSRSLSIAGGTQGSYDLFLSYDEIPHFTTDSASTPYLATGSDVLTLPAGWVTAGTTAAMTSLTPNLKNVRLDTRRKNLGVGLSFTPDSPWGYKVSFRQDTKQGAKAINGSFFFNSAQLIEPVDYVTDEIDASISYTTRQWQANLAYFGSTFSNNNQSLTWQNAYTPSTAGADTGQLALPPDNEFHQFILSGGYQISDRSRVSGDIAVGRMEQNQALLAATQNTNFGSLALPSGKSANAEVDTTNAKLKFISMLTEKLRLNASYSYDERDNKTPQLLYDWVITDGFLAPQLANRPYSITRSSVKLNADYRQAKGARLGLGYDLDSKKQTFQDVEKTDENTLWGTIRVRHMNNVNVNFKLAHSEREVSASQSVVVTDPAQNILHSKYNMADRVRDSTGLHINMMPQPEYSIGLSMDYSRDNYDKSILGLTNSREVSMNGDVTVMLSESTSFNVFIGQQKIKSAQAGYQSFPAADWFANNDDTFNNTGFGIMHVLIQDRLDIGADYSRSRSTSDITISVGAIDPVFPRLRTDLESIKLYANYRLDETLSVRAAYWHESYDTTDWTRDAVSADTIPNLLSFGELSPAYSNDVIKLAMRYTF